MLQAFVWKIHNRGSIIYITYQTKQINQHKVVRTLLVRRFITAGCLDQNIKVVLRIRKRIPSTVQVICDLLEIQSDQRDYDPTRGKRK